MEGNKKKTVASSSSTFTSDLFGSKENHSSSIFGSIFPPMGKEPTRSEEFGKKQTYVYQGTNSKSNEWYSESNETNPYCQEQRVQPPCHLSSSIYYGGPDVYFRPQNTQPRVIYRDEAEDDSGSASPGNWWKGSLYY